jgi:hypothetical protein
VAAIGSGGTPLDEPELDVHLHEVIGAATQAARDGRAVAVESRFPPFDALRLEPAAERSGHVHDRTRPAGLQ